jgi:hypothetical protein
MLTGQIIGINMNKVDLIDTQNVLFANRTIETLLINEQQTLYLYNHQGQYFKLFDQKKELTNYLNALPYRMVTEFYSEEALDDFLLQASK